MMLLLSANIIGFRLPFFHAMLLLIDARCRCCRVAPHTRLLLIANGVTLLIAARRR